MDKYRKFIVAVVGVIALALATFFGIGDGTSLFGMSGDQIAGLIVTILTALGVYQVPNAT